ncbi:hypothetical protein QF012_006054, partial [Pseudomonas laurylsulfatiphila]
VSAWAWPLVGAGLSGRRIAAMVVNDNAYEPDERGALESIAGKPAPTVSAWARSFVGAGLPAMVVNDNACKLDNAARLSPSPAGWLLQVLRYRCFPRLREEPFSLA